MYNIIQKNIIEKGKGKEKEERTEKEKEVQTTTKPLVLENQGSHLTSLRKEVDKVIDGVVNDDDDVLTQNQNQEQPPSKKEVEQSSSLQTIVKIQTNNHIKGDVGGSKGSYTKAIREGVNIEVEKKKIEKVRDKDKEEKKTKKEKIVVTTSAQSILEKKCSGHNSLLTKANEFIDGVVNDDDDDDDFVTQNQNQEQQPSVGEMNISKNAEMKQKELEETQKQLEPLLERLDNSKKNVEQCQQHLEMASAKLCAMTLEYNQILEQIEIKKLQYSITLQQPTTTLRHNEKNELLQPQEPRNGRFLWKHASTDKWRELNDEEAFQKVRNALYEANRNRRRGTKNREFGSLRSSVMGRSKSNNNINVEIAPALLIKRNAANGNSNKNSKSATTTNNNKKNAAQILLPEWYNKKARLETVHKPGTSANEATVLLYNDENTKMGVLPIPTTHKYLRLDCIRIPSTNRSIGRTFCKGCLAKPGRYEKLNGINHPKPILNDTGKAVPRPSFGCSECLVVLCRACFEGGWCHLQNMPRTNIINT